MFSAERELSFLLVRTYELEVFSSKAREIGNTQKWKTVFGHLEWSYA